MENINRIKIYKEYSFGTGNFPTLLNEKKTDESTTIETQDDIQYLFNILKRDSIKIEIDGFNNRFLEQTLIRKSTNGEIILHNKEHFLDNIEENTLECKVFYQGTRYDFNLNIKNKNHDKHIITCDIPELITKTPLRVAERVDTRNIKEAVLSIWWEDKQTEFIGKITDISDVGMGTVFNAHYFDSNFYSQIRISKNLKIKSLIFLEGDYFPISQEIKMIKFNENNNEIFIGSAFAGLEEENFLKLQNYIKNLNNYSIVAEAKFNSIKAINNGLIGRSI